MYLFQEYARRVLTHGELALASSVNGPVVANHHVSSMSSSAASTSSASSGANNATVGNGSAAPPELPPRMSGAPPQPPRVPDHHHHHHLKEADYAPPPPPPPRQNYNPPPPAPPRGTTPPPNSAPVAGTTVGVTSASNPPQLLKRMSPITVAHPARVVQHQPGQTPKHQQQRGTSPVTAQQPMRVPNTREIRQQVQQLQQNLQNINLSPEEALGAIEPPAPYPMGQYAAGASAHPPPSYSQSLAMRQSPTLSTTSSDYRTPSSADFRRSPAPMQASILQHHASSFTPMMASAVPSSSTVTGPSPVPVAASPSPASSMLSSSSRTSSSVHAWSARQAKTHSPVIMHSVKSTLVQKPVLQSATAVAEAAALNATQQGQQQTVIKGQDGKPPPSYEFSMQQKHSGNLPLPHPSSPSASSSQSGSSPTPTRIAAAASAVPTSGLTSALTAPVVNSVEQQRPPPPPYPSTAVASMKDAAAGSGQPGLVSGTQVSGKQGHVISTAKVVSNRQQHGNLPLPPPQRKHSAPVTASPVVVMAPSEAVGGSPAPASAASRSESPVSDSHTISASPVSFHYSEATRTASSATDSGLMSAELSMQPPPPQSASLAGSVPRTTHHHTSPKPERRQLPPEEETRKKSLIHYCSSEAYKFYMEQHIENIMKERERRKQRR